MRLALLLYFLLLSGFTSAEVYRYVDSRGQVAYTDTPPHDGYIQLVKTWKGWREMQGYDNSYGNFKRNRSRYWPLVESAAARYALSPQLLDALIHTESYYNPRAVSRAGAVGLMQLMPATARRYGVSNRQNPAQNIDAGSRYLRDLLAMFEGDVRLALAAYNAGENAVLRHGRQVPPFAETRKYVRKVMALYRTE